MKKRVLSILLSLCFALDLFFVPITFAQESSDISIAYVSESGSISGVSQDLVFTSISEALAAIGNSQGTIYVSGNVSFPEVFGDDTYGAGEITIAGHNGTSDRIKFPENPANIKRDLVFENVSLKPYEKDERWISAQNSTVTFFESCITELSDPYALYNGSKVTTGIYIGQNDAVTGDAHYILKDSDAEITMIAPIGRYGSDMYVNGNVTFDLYAGNYDALYGISRNGDKNGVLYSTLNGDVTYNIYGGNYNTFVTANHTGGFINGNIIFNFNGGNFNNNITIGNLSQSSSGGIYFKEYTKLGDTVLIFNAKELEQSGATWAKAVITQGDFAEIDKNKTILIFNNNEISGYYPAIDASEIDHKIYVNNGKITPVYAESSLGTAGELLGFDIVSDDPMLSPRIQSGDFLEKNANGYYDIPLSSVDINVEFGNPYEGKTFKATFKSGTKKAADDISAAGNTFYTLPVCTYTRKGYYFSGWRVDSEMFSTGDSVLATANVNYAAVWTSNNQKEAVYVSATGSDSNPGFSQYCPLKSLSAALQKAYDNNLSKIFVKSAITSDGLEDFPQFGYPITITGEGFDGSICFNATIKAHSDITFENMGLACEQYCFIETNCYDVVFGEGLKGIGEKGIYAHIGKDNSTAENLSCTIKSGKFDMLYLGGAYFTTGGVGVSGDAVLNIENVKDLNLTVGFDGFTGKDSERSFERNIFINMKNSSIASITSSRVSEIKGSLVVVNKGGSVFPKMVDIPTLKGGMYFINSPENIEISSATDGNGVIPSAIKFNCDDESKYIRISKDGINTYHKQGAIQLEDGQYTVCEEAFAFDVGTPVAGFKSKNKTVSTDDYYANIVWYQGEDEVERFEEQKTYTAKVSLSFYNRDTQIEGLALKINGNSCAASFADGIYTASYTFPATSKKNIIYVSSSGNDTKDGKTAAQPVATINKALEKLGSAGIICLMDKMSVSGALASHSFPILITGEGYSSAEVSLGNSVGIILGGETEFENIRITMGLYSHINDNGKKLTFDDSVELIEGKILHVGYFSQNIKSSNVVIGDGTFFDWVFLGGAYNEEYGKYIEEDINLTVNGTDVGMLYLSLDNFNDSHKGVTLNGNTLITLNGDASVLALYKSEQTVLTYSQDSVYQIILNDNASFPEVSDSMIPENMRYMVKVGEGGRVLHAFDKNGKSISGTFDILPDEGNLALIEQDGKTSVTPGGRVKLLSGKTANVSFIKCDYPLETYSVDLDGGKVYGQLFNVDTNGNVSFIRVPEKEGHIFEGWYADGEFSEIVTDGSFVGAEISLYAKYIPVSFEPRMEKFAVKETQIRFEAADKPQGLRFITAISKDVLEKVASFSDKNASLLTGALDDIGYGSVAAPAIYLGEKRLEINSNYVYEGEIYGSKKAPAKNIFDMTDDTIYYTVCITGIEAERYEKKYNVAPYITYYTRSGNKATVYGNVYSSGMVPAAFEMLEKGDVTEQEDTFLRENMAALYAENRGIELIPQSVLKQISDKTAQYKQNVVESANMSLSNITGTIYYVSNKGKDNNEGKSQRKAWASIEKVNSVDLKPGDAVLFERGGEFRGNIIAREGVTYSAYGTGAKPIINGSPRNFADAALWAETGIENVYMTRTSFYQDIGFLAFDHDKVAGDYDELISIKKISGVEYDGRIFTNQNDLEKDLEFYYDPINCIIYLYSEDGNPAERFNSIEIAPIGHLVDVTVGGVTVDNLHFRNSGSHGVGGLSGYGYYSNGQYVYIESWSNLKVTNCIFAWIGGAILEGTTRYGNAVEIFGSVDGFVVENNWIYQIYDTGITHQYTAGNCGNSLMQNIEYINNLIEYCHWSIEFYNQPCCEYHTRIVRDVLYEGNIVRMGGYGWGSRTRKTEATLYNSFGLSNVESETENFHTKDNIFFLCTGPIYRLNENRSERNLSFEGNIHVQVYENLFSWYCGTEYRFKDVQSCIGNNSQIPDASAITYFYAP